jgi:hypothetical protein
MPQSSAARAVSQLITAAQPQAVTQAPNGNARRHLSLDVPCDGSGSVGMAMSSIANTAGAAWRWQGKVFLLRNCVMQVHSLGNMHQLEICPRLLADPAMWAAEIRDAVTNDVIWSSWADEWIAYDTVDEATARAIAMLPQLSLSRATAA